MKDLAKQRKFGKQLIEEKRFHIKTRETPIEKENAQLALKTVKIAFEAIDVQRQLTEN